MWKTVNDWRSALWQKKLWFLSLGTYKFFEDRVLAWANAKIDEQAGWLMRILTFIIDHLAVATGVVTLVTIVILLGITWIESRKLKPASVLGWDPRHRRSSEPSQVVSNPFETRIRRQFEFNEHGAKGAEEAHKLLVYYDHQKAQWHSFVQLELTGVDCSNAQAATPYIVAKFQVRNYLLESWKLTSIEKGVGEVRTKFHGILNLPPLKLEESISVDQCSEVEFSVTLYINGTGIPGPLLSASMAGESVSWSFKAFWKVNIYDGIRDGWTPSFELRWEGVPIVSGRVS